MDPVALAPKGDRMALVDAAGAVLPFDPLASAPDLPVLIGGGQPVARALARARDYDPGLFARIERPGGWARMSSSRWMVAGSGSARSLRRRTYER